MLAHSKAPRVILAIKFFFMVMELGIGIKHDSFYILKDEGKDKYNV